VHNLQRGFQRALALHVGESNLTEAAFHHRWASALGKGRERLLESLSIVLDEEVVEPFPVLFEELLVDRGTLRIPGEVDRDFRAKWIAVSGGSGSRFTRGSGSLFGRSRKRRSTSLGIGDPDGGHLGRGLALEV
jgi:hypothetical protein